MKISSKTIVVSLLVCYQIFIVSHFYYNPKGTIAFCKKIDGIERIEENGFVLSTGDIFNIVYELCPIVEEITGKKFTNFPKLQLIKKKELEDILTTELVLQFNNVLSSKSQQSIFKIACSRSQKISKYIIGKYSFTDKTIYLLPENINIVIKEKQLKKKTIKIAMTLIIAHEMIHALQDEQINFTNKIDKMYNFEQLDAFAATIEGHAMFVQNQIQRYLYKSEKRPLNNQTKHNDLNCELNQSIEQDRLRDTYINGMSFIEYYFNRGGTQKVWEILFNPPTRTSMILKPETYNSYKIEKIDYIEILSGLECFFGREKYVIENIDLPVTQFLSLLAGSNLKNKEIASNIAHIQVLTIFKKKIFYGMISFVEVSDKKYGYKLKALLEELLKNSIQKLKQTYDFEIQSIPKTVFGENEEIFNKTIIIIGNNKAKPSKNTIVLLAGNRIIVEIVDPFGKLTDIEIDEIIKEVAKRYYKVKQLKL